ncbi:helix-turn-helix domain-containing protein [Bosea eneae]|uniref:Helix-turn-helix domain-containing protein n=1 Tax=Bosea eneae TaxID=151454 RepID=A0ABW0IX02_9HYPH
MNDDAYRHVPKELRTAGTDGVGIIRLRQPEGFYTRPAADEFTLQLVADDNRPHRARVDHGTKFDCRTRPGALCLAPSRADLGYSVDGDLAIMVVFLGRDRIRSVIEARSARRWQDDFGGLHAKLFRHDAVRHLLRDLWVEASRGSPHGALYADSAVETIVLGLLSASGVQLAPAPEGGLAPWALRRVLEYLEDRIDQDTSLSELASVVGFSSNHFCTAFRRSTGVPPHRWLTRRRVERAKAMLLDPLLSVTEVALACGFSSSAHFATTFRKHVGASPSAWRRERLS